MQISPSISLFLTLFLAVAALVKAQTATNVKSCYTNENAITCDNIILVGRSEFIDHNSRFSELEDCILIDFSTLDELEREIIKRMQEVNVHIILPTSYPQMKIISLNQEYLERKYEGIVFFNSANYEACVHNLDNKCAFSIFMQKNGWQDLVPKTILQPIDPLLTPIEESFYDTSPFLRPEECPFASLYFDVFTDPEQITLLEGWRSEEQQSLRYPIIFKFAFGYGGQGYEILYSRSDLEKAIGRAGQKRFLLQEYIKGHREYSANLLLKNGDIHACIIYEEEHKTDMYIQSGRMRNFKRIDPIKEEYCKTKFQIILKNISYTGFCCVNFKINEKSQIDQNDDQNNAEEKYEIQIFEINPRLGGTLISNLSDFLFMLQTLQDEV